MLNPLMYSVIHITWDPMIRGFLIILVAFLFLVGSVYLLLATNTGVRTGLLLATAGLSGMMFMLCMVWSVYGLAQGPAGRPASWKCVEIVSGSTPFAAKAADAYPASFSLLDEKDAKQSKALGDASAAADKFLVTASTAPDSHGVVPDPPECSGETYTAPFGSATEYQRTSGFITGGERYPMVGNNVDLIAFFHKPKYIVIEVQKVLSEPAGFTAVPRRSAIDPTGQRVRILLIRDLGSRRLPTLLYGLGFGLVFGAACYHLHRRERLNQLGDVKISKSSSSAGARENETVNA